MKLAAAPTRMAGEWMDGWRALGITGIDCARCAGHC